MIKITSDCQGRSQDLNQPLQNIVQNFDDDVIIMTLTSLFDTGEEHENFKFCAISLNKLHTSGLCGVLRLIAPLSIAPLLHE